MNTPAFGAASELKADLVRHQEADERAFGVIGERLTRQDVSLARIETKLSSAGWFLTTLIAFAGVAIGALGVLAVVHR